MNHEGPDLSPVTVRDILSVAFKYKRHVLAIFLAAVFGALAYLLYIKPTYEAGTKILVQLGREKAEAVETAAARSNVVFAARAEDIRNEIEILKDKSVTYAVLPELKDWLDKAYRPPTTVLGRIRAWAGEAFRAAKNLAYQPLYALGLAVELTPTEEFALALQAALDAERIEETDVIRLKFSWSNPQFAAVAANAFAQEYVRRRIHIHTTAEAERFYSDQIGLHRSRLADIEREIEKFRRDRGISSFDLQRELLLKDVAQLERNHSDAGIELNEVEAKLGNIRRVQRRTDEWLETPMVGNIVPDLTALDRRYFELLAERNRLLDTNTPQSRAVRSLNEQMAALRIQKFQSLENFLRAQIDGVTKRREVLGSTLEVRRKALRALDQSMPALGELNRQRDLIEREYTEYSKKAEEFRISEALSKQRITSVKVLGPALPPEKPAKPWVSVILALAALLGLFLGFAYATVAEYFDHTFRDREDVDAALGVPLLVTIPEMKHHARAASRPA